MKRQWVVSLVLASAGCAVLDLLPDVTLSEFKRTGPKQPPYTGTVQVVDKEPPGSVQLGVVWVSGQDYEWEELIDDMKQRAAKAGANAIMVTERKEVKKEEGDKFRDGKVSGSYYRQYYEKHMRATAFRTPD